MRLQATERQIQRACLELLAAKGIVHHRLNSGMMRGEHNGKPWAVKLAPAGTADILALVSVPNGVQMDFFLPLYIECKTATGKQSAAQLEFQRTVTAKGCKYIVVRDVQQLVEYFKRLGR